MYPQNALRSGSLFDGLACFGAWRQQCSVVEVNEHECRTLLLVLLMRASQLSETCERWAKRCLSAPVCFLVHAEMRMRRCPAVFQSHDGVQLLVRSPRRSQSECAPGHLQRPNVTAVRFQRGKVGTVAASRTRRSGRHSCLCKVRVQPLLPTVFDVPMTSGHPFCSPRYRCAFSCPSMKSFVSKTIRSGGGL